MVVVEVGDEYRVDATERLDVIKRTDTPQVRHAAPERWIGEEPYAVELDKDGTMAHPGDGVAHES